MQRDFDLILAPPIIQIFGGKYFLFFSNMHAYISPFFLVIITTDSSTTTDELLYS